MRIVSWNVNGLRAAAGKGAFAAIAGLEPDALCLQETRVAEEMEVLPGYGCHLNAGDRRGYAGTAILTREEPLAVSMGPGAPDPEGRCLTAEYESLYLVCAYAPRSCGELRRRQARVDFDDALLGHLEALMAEKPVVLCGDMNAVIDDVDDVYEGNPHRGEEEEGWASDERELLLSVLDLGFADAFRLLHPDEKDAFTWWSQRRNRRSVNHGWRLDYFFVSEDAADAVSRCEHLTDLRGSDHCPILLDVAL